MKQLTTLFIFAFISFASAQQHQIINKKDIVNTIKSNTITLNIEQRVVVRIKGAKSMNNRDIENYNKVALLKMIAKSKKPKVC